VSREEVRRARQEAADSLVLLLDIAGILGTSNSVLRKIFLKTGLPSVRIRDERTAHQSAVAMTQETAKEFLAWLKANGKCGLGTERIASRDEVASWVEEIKA
jgi:hypothetical protein